MIRSRRATLLAFVSMVCVPGPVFAGMPSINLTDIARMRVRSISFFLMGLLLSAWFVQLLWNYLRRDFVRSPRLSYGKALGIVALWGLLFVLVLTMISGARELLTPGAWDKQGLTYRLSQPEANSQAERDHERERRRKIDDLRAVLWDYARAHGGRFPASDTAGDIPRGLWLASESPHARYLYVAGLLADEGAIPLVYEPGCFGDRRLVLRTDGTVQAMTVEEILQALPPEKP